jgi:hypothetical protein
MALVAGLLSTVSVPLHGHHSLSAVYDLQQTITLTGELSSVDWRNPHVMLELEVATSPTERTTWTLEGASTSFFQHGNVPKDRFLASVGQSVTIKGYVARSGPGRVALKEVAFADGTIVGVSPCC